MTGFSILLICLILAYGFCLARYVPERLHFMVNCIASLLAIAVGLWHGLSFEAMGLGLHLIPKGIIVALVCSLGISLVAGLISAFISTKRIFDVVPQITRPGKIAYETAVRIPLSTALSEEILFRGVLLAVLMQSSPTLVSVIICSIVFGIWHVQPSNWNHTKITVLPTVVVTAIAGLFFCWLQLLAHSIIAPWLVHWTINASALLTIHFVRTRVHNAK
jgi:membrane protease YdiL (CAAX protease family)